MNIHPYDSINFRLSWLRRCTLDRQSIYCSLLPAFFTTSKTKAWVKRTAVYEENWMSEVCLFALHLLTVWTDKSASREKRWKRAIVRRSKEALEGKELGKIKKLLLSALSNQQFQLSTGLIHNLHTTSMTTTTITTTTHSTSWCCQRVITATSRHIKSITTTNTARLR